MELAAQRFDEALGSPLQGGTVLGVHAHACTWESKNGTLTTLLPATTAPVPMGMILSTPEDFSFADHVAVGKKVAVRAGIVRFDGGDLSVDTRSARAWNGRLDRDPIALPPAAIDDAWRIVTDCGTASARAFCLGGGATENSPIIAIGGAKIIASLVIGTEAMNNARVESAAVALIGRGHGLTPSGDDFLVGFLAGLWSRAGACQEHETFVRGLAQAITANRARTNPVSATYLRAAADARVGGGLHSVIDGLRSGAPNSREKAIRRAIGIGHESGTCTLIGLLAGLDCWSEDRPSKWILKRPC